MTKPATLALHEVFLFPPYSALEIDERERGGPHFYVVGHERAAQRGTMRVPATPSQPIAVSKGSCPAFNRCMLSVEWPGNCQQRPGNSEGHRKQPHGRGSCLLLSELIGTIAEERPAQLPKHGTRLTLFVALHIKTSSVCSQGQAPQAYQTRQAAVVRLLLCKVHRIGVPEPRARHGIRSQNLSSRQGMLESCKGAV